MNSLIDDWNKVIPSFQITNDDLLKPKPMFFVEMMLKVFETLDIQMESLLKLKLEMSNDENLDAFNDIIPLLILTEAINYMSLEIYENSVTTTLVDLIMPTKSMVDNVSCLFYNFILFVQERRNCIAKREEDIEEKAQQLNRMINEKDKLKIEIDELRLDNMKLEKEINKMNNDVSKYKEYNIELEKEVNELNSEYDFIKMENEAVASTLEKQRNIQAGLSEEIIRLKSLIVTDAEQTEVIARKDVILQREQELQQEMDDINNMLWKKEANIKTLEKNIVYMSECNTMFDNLVGLYQKIGEMNKTITSTDNEERELCNYQKNVTNLEKKVAELQNLSEQLTEQINIMNVSTENELMKLSKEEDMLLNECEKSKTTSTEYQHKIDELQVAVIQHFKEYKEIMHLYTEEIPAQYDEMIDDYVSKIEKIMDKLRKF